MTTVDECAQAILNEWRQVEPATAHVLAHMAARVAAACFAAETERDDKRVRICWCGDLFCDGTGHYRQCGVAVSDSQETPR